MLKRSSKYNPSQFDLVLKLTNKGRDNSLRTQTWFCLDTSVGNLVPLGEVEGYIISSNQGKSIDSGSNMVGGNITGGLW